MGLLCKMMGTAPEGSRCQASREVLSTCSTYSQGTLCGSADEIDQSRIWTVSTIYTRARAFLFGGKEESVA